jgi:hypothetical protein
MYGSDQYKLNILPLCDDDGPDLLIPKDLYWLSHFFFIKSIDLFRSSSLFKAASFL